MGIFVMAEVPLHVRSSKCALGVEGLTPGEQLSQTLRISFSSHHHKLRDLEGLFFVLKNVQVRSEEEKAIPAV